jgi:hypothetical protein
MAPAPKRQRRNGDGDSSSSDNFSSEPVMEEVSSEEEMNLPESEEIKLFRRRACSGDTSDSENDSIGNEEEEEEMNLPDSENGSNEDDEDQFSDEDF